MGDLQRHIATGLLAAATATGATLLFIPEGDVTFFGEAGRLGDLFADSAVPGVLVLGALLAPVFSLAGTALAAFRKGLGYVFGLVGGLAHANGVALVLVNDGKLPFTSSGVPFYLLCAAAVLGIAAGIVGMLAPPSAAKKRPDVALPPVPVISTENPHAFNPLASREPRSFKADPPREFREFQVTSRPAVAPSPDQISSWDEVPDEDARVPVAPPAPKPPAPTPPAAAKPPAPAAAKPAALPAPAAKPAAPAAPPKPAAPAAAAKPAAPPAAKPAPAAGAPPKPAAPAKPGAPPAPKPAAAPPKAAAPAGPAKPAAKQPQK